DGGGSCALHLEPEFVAELGEARARSAEEGRLQEGGRRLFEAMFQGQVATSLRRSEGRLDPGGREALRLRLVFDPLEPSVAELANLPWEWLWDPGGQCFLARTRGTSLVRSFELAYKPPRPSPGPGKLKVLAVNAPANWQGVHELRQELAELEATALSSPAVEVEALPVAELARLRERLLDGGHHVCHFMGHGEVGKLLMSDGRGGAQVAEAERVAELLRDLPELRLVFLNACSTGRLPEDDAFRSLPVALLSAGVPAVIATREPILGQAATRLSARLYRRLAAGDPLEAALVEGRLALDGTDGAPDWHLPMLFLRPDAEPILPLPPALSPALRGEIRDFSQLIEERSRAFVGRGFLFEALERFMARADRGYFCVESLPGLGKTAVAAELVRQRGLVHHFNSRAEGVIHPRTFLRSLCARLIAEHGLDYAALPESAGTDSAFLSEILVRVSEGLPAGKPQLLVVDALDESDLESLPVGSNPLYLPRFLPPGIFFVLTSQKLSRGIDLEGPLEKVPLLRESAEQRADVAEHIRHHLGLPGIARFQLEHGLSEQSFVALLVEKSQANFMYLRHVLPALASRALSALDPEDIPQGLEQYYRVHWEHMKARAGADWFETALPVLAALTVWDEPLTVRNLARALRIERSARLRGVLQDWRAFLQESRSPEGEAAFQLYHRSFHAFIRDQDQVEGERVDLQLTRERIFENLLEAEGRELKD
ncbi:MAG TPA: CHAT domain-containing protein, partial [Thermoanaerobaculia bacterium]|nr:CHAT domain-containing protein [Thermoanaerobaculia bacterium]